MMLVTYDIDISSDDSSTRLRRVAKICEDYGLRVQNSVFEMLIDQSQLIKLKSRLSNEIDHERDSIRFYRLGNNYKNRIEILGLTSRITLDGPLIL